MSGFAYLFVAGNHERDSAAMQTELIKQISDVLVARGRHDLAWQLWTVQANNAATSAASWEKITVEDYVTGEQFELPSNTRVHEIADRHVPLKSLSPGAYFTTEDRFDAVRQVTDSDM